MRSTITCLLAVAALAMSACGSGDEATTTGTSLVPQGTTGPTDAATEPTESDTELVEDLMYFDDEPGLRPPLLDVVAPVEEGTWPVVVTFHPDSAVNSRSTMSRLALAIAAEGAVVFNPSYGHPVENAGRSADFFRTDVEQASCAVWYAIEHAAEYGGDPSDIRVVGFSGGAMMAAAVAMYPSDDDARCRAPASDFTVSEVVAFEGDFAMGSGWDDVVREDPSFYDEMTVWSHIPNYDGGPIHVLVDSETNLAITDVEEFLDLRHPDGAIRDAWEELGVVEENRATLVQSNEMFHTLLLEAGHETTLTTITALGHSLGLDAEAAIIELVFAND